MEIHSHIIGLADIILVVCLIIQSILIWMGYRFLKNYSIKTTLYALDKIQAGIWDYRPLKGKFLLNRRRSWQIFLGKKFHRPELTVDEFYSFIYPEDLHQVKNAYSNYISSGGKGEFELYYRFCRPDGRWQWIFSKGKAVKWDKSGIPSRILGVDFDIQTLMEAQDQVRKSELKFKTIFENAPYTISINRLEDGKFIEANRAFLNSHGITREELTQLSSLDMKLLSEQKKAELTQKLLDKGTVKDQEVTVIRKDGRKAFISISSTLMDFQGEKQVLAIAEDITDKKNAEEALKESEKRFRMLFKMAPTPMAHIARNGKILDVNDSLTMTMGYTINEVPTLTHAWDQTMPDPEVRKATSYKWEHDLENAITNNCVIDPLKVPFRYMDGSIHDVIISTRLIDNNIIISFFDITDIKEAEAEREKLQEQLHQAQKLEAIGLLAGGVAHDFNNMLGAITGYTEMIMLETPQADPNRSKLENILKAAQRSADLTRQLLAFARKQTIAPVTLNLNESIESVLKMIRRLIGENIELVWHPESSACNVLIDPTQIDQILINFCVNAKDAINDVGRIVIETDSVFLDEYYCDTYTYFRPGQYAMFAVSDNGAGMEKETLKHIFEPFYTTKEPGKGTGLGLATVYGIVKQNNGFIHAYSEQGEGTTFKVYLPLVSGTTEGKQKDDAVAVPAGNGETVLIVEDDETILRMGAMMLEKLGYRVLAASTPNEGLSLAEENKAEIQALITDIVMPGMNGRDLAEQLKLIIPDIKVLFMSGYTATVIAQQREKGEKGNFMQKPFTIMNLALAMHKILGQEISQPENKL